MAFCGAFCGVVVCGVCGGFLWVSVGLGADDYLTKPFDMNLLSLKITSIIKNRTIVKDKTLKLLKETNDEPIINNEHNDKFIKKALELIRLNIADPNFDRDEFASKMNVSPSLLYKKN